MALFAGTALAEPGAASQLTLEEALTRGVRVGCTVGPGRKLGGCEIYADVRLYSAEVQQAVIDRAVNTDPARLAGLMPRDRVYFDVGRDADWVRWQTFNPDRRNKYRVRFLVVPTPVGASSEAVVLPPAGPGLIANPVWRRRPAPEKMVELFPAAAREQEVQGFAAVECRVTRDGDLTGCHVIAETPIGFGFGAAASELAQYFQISTVDHNPNADTTVRLPIHWRIG